MTSDSVAGTVGENLYRLRISAGESQGEAAQRVSRYGLAWKRDHVAALEIGRRATVGVDELVILSTAYDVPLAQWFAGDGPVTLSEGVTSDRAALREAFQGAAPQSTEPIEADFSNVVDLEADQRVADRLGVDQDVVTAIAHELWGHTLTEERNRRLADSPTKDPKALRTLRGGMTKRLMREVELHMKEKRMK